MNVAFKTPGSSDERRSRLLALSASTVAIVAVVVLACTSAWYACATAQSGEKPGEPATTQDEEAAGEPAAAQDTRAGKVAETQEQDRQRVDREAQQRARRAASTDPREQAINALLEQIDQDPENATLHYQLANSYQEAGYLHSALQHFNESVRIDATNSRAWNNRGSVLKDLNRHEQALESFHKALEIDSLDVMARVNLGDEYLLQKRYQDAVDSYREALEIDPTSINAYYSLAISFAETGMYRDAARAWRQAAKLDQEANGEDSSVATRALENAKLMEEIVEDAAKQVAEREQVKRELEAADKEQPAKEPE